MTREEILRLYEKANGWSPAGWEKTELDLERFAALVAAHEREQCAKVCEEKSMVKGGEVFAARIRARGEK